ncbi:hypothetical protein Tsubulata_006527 [Turnera subulata]|uniref:Uncharacterized protein n=1 Tax=Turnera subulata TaxID=218843 RepID=A0A9Q0JMT2_9ROSI|nr:hypothetical protein Tsubulata_006527 [Turnera subulata]
MEREKFARLAIEVELTMPLLGHAEIEGRWFGVSRQVRAPNQRRDFKDAGARIASNPFGIGSATALLKEVLRDAKDASSSSTSQLMTPVVFQALAMNQVSTDKMTKTGTKSKGRKSGEDTTMNSSSSKGAQQERATEVVPQLLNRKVQTSKVDPMTKVAPIEAGIPKQFRKGNSPLMDSLSHPASSSVDVDTVRGAYMGGNKASLEEYGSLQVGSSNLVVDLPLNFNG